MLSLAAEPFITVQGEGANAGRAALFIRFSGCNLWSGHGEDRVRDADRHGSPCPLWCDTDFRPLVRTRPKELIRAAQAAYDVGVRLLVFTGGEPALQLTADLLDEMPEGLDLAIETNGTKELPKGLDWVTVSPKVGPDDLVVVTGNELKVVVPAFDPAIFDEAQGKTILFDRHLFVQPQSGSLGAVRTALDWVKAHPEWRVSFQAHKGVGLP